MAASDVPPRKRRFSGGGTSEEGSRSAPPRARLPRPDSPKNKGAPKKKGATHFDGPRLLLYRALFVTPVKMRSERHMRALTTSDAGID